MRHHQDGAHAKKEPKLHTVGKLLTTQRGDLIGSAHPYSTRRTRQASVERKTSLVTSSRQTATPEMIAAAEAT